MLALFIVLPWTVADAALCYTCSGGCFKAEGCNCQFGMCEGPYCFSERKPQYDDKNLKYQVVKGCAKNPSQKMGCHFVRDENTLSCVCQGEFCNAMIEPPELPRPSISCYQCPSYKSCRHTCDGHYCAKDLISGMESCGYGQPYLPYSNRHAGELLPVTRWAEPDGIRACVTTEMGIHRHAECICLGELCNRGFVPHSPYPSHDLNRLPLESSLLTGERALLFSCFSCSRHAEDNVLPPECQEQTCLGQFCVLSIETRTKDKPTGVIRNAGCLNTTNPAQVEVGCSQRWRGKEHEVIHCACLGDFCNVNLHTAFASPALRPRPSLLPALGTLALVIWTWSS